MSGRNDTPGVNASPDLREKAARQFAYLRELAKLRLSTVRDCRDYEEALFFTKFQTNRNARVSHDPICLMTVSRG